MKTLVIVESPGKIEKIQSILGDKYCVIASYGHIIDLDPNTMSINSDFEPNDIVLATDKDREGEMIAWSIQHVLEERDLKRITFTAINEKDIMNGIKNPKNIDNNLVEAQKLRRILDRIIGYNISPILQKVINGRQLSAGRVQSVIVKLIIEREQEIEDYKYESYYKINCNINNTLNGVLKYEENEVKTEKKPIELLKQIDKSEFHISDLINKKRTQSASFPYTTSTLQQEAQRKLNFTSKRTMMIAQHLYEKGYITYMRTDSINIANDAKISINEYINKTYGEKYINNKIKIKKTKGQEAHEAIRPTYMNNIIIGTEDEKRLYNLIFKRTIASQMIPAIYNVNIIKIRISEMDKYYIESKYENIDEVGYLIVYNQEINNMEMRLSINQKVNITKVRANEEYKNIPHRYDDASLINKLDPTNLNIGRPSTYATFIEKIQEKEYVIKKNIDGNKRDIMIITIENGEIIENKKEIIIGKEDNKFVPTNLGRMVTKYLNDNFKIIMDYKFTEEIENELDEVANGKKKWIDIIKRFNNILNKLLENVNLEKINTEIKELGIHPVYKNKIILCNCKNGLMIKTIKNNKDIVLQVPDKFTSDTITNEDAIRLLEYPKEIGKYERKKITMHEGKFGYYIKYGKQNISIDNMDMKLEEIIDIIKSRIIWEQKDNENKYKIQRGPYGLYINVQKIKENNKGKNYKLPEKYEIDKITIDEIKKIITKPKMLKTFTLEKNVSHFLQPKRRFNKKMIKK